MSNPIVVAQLGQDRQRQRARPSRRAEKRHVLMEVLRNSPLFAYATDRDLRNVTRHAQPKTVPAGKTIMREGDAGDRFCVVLDGCVRVTRNGRKVVDLGAGKGFGELALLTNAPRTATVTAVDDTELVSFDRKTFGKLLDESPAFARRLLQAVASRLRERDAKSVQ
jgi:CRP-like cAMP-binding protein